MCYLLIFPGKGYSFHWIILLFVEKWTRYQWAGLSLSKIRYLFITDEIAWWCCILWFWKRWKILWVRIWHILWLLMQIFLLISKSFLISYCCWVAIRSFNRRNRSISLIWAKKHQKWISKSTIVCQDLLTCLCWIWSYSNLII